MVIICNDRTFNVRKASSKDGPIIQKMVFEVLEEYNLIPEPEGIDADLLDVDNVYSDGYFGVIMDKDGIIGGTFGLYKMSDDTAEIRKMYLKKEMRGFGLGKWMVKYLIDISKDLGFKNLELETASQLVEAIALYSKMGFSEVKQENQTPRCDKSFLLKLK